MSLNSGGDTSSNATSFAAVEGSAVRTEVEGSSALSVLMSSAPSVTETEIHAALTEFRTSKQL